MKTNKNIPCDECNDGFYEEVCENYTAITSDDNKVLVRNLRFKRCTKCGDEIFSPQSSKIVDKTIADFTEQLRTREIELLWEDLGLDQTAASEALGLGAKTLHRWLKGTQYPNRSMGFYLRAMVQFPEAFQWVKERAWRKKNRLSQSNTSTTFPELFSQLEKEQHNEASTKLEALRNFNPVKEFRRISVK